MSFLLTCPYLLFILVTFALPIGVMLLRSVQNPELGETMPATAAAFQEWPGGGLPPEALVRIFAADVIAARENQTITLVAKRLNVEIAGFRGLLLSTARQMPAPDSGNLQRQLIDLDSRWSEPRYWAAIKHAAPRYTVRYLLATIDREFDVDGSIVKTAPDQRIYLTLLARTLWISVAVTLICLALGYPVAYLLAGLPTRYSNLLMLLLLLPFWTSLLVRTTAWLVLLQREGLINDLAIWFGVTNEPMELVRNRFGVYVAMTHILLPFMVLPIFSVMKGISPSHMRAAFSLGAGPMRAFVRIYLPQTLPGICAGGLLVFIMSLGYYITPALVGGPADQMLSYFIAFNANATLNWGLAGALSIVLMLCVGVFFAIYSRIVGIDKLRLG
ncbi:MAG: ABC transporter permease [Rhodospirillales bacterium]|nr:ABC transporter permease [Rhodospirillales bacterium]